MKWYKNPVFLLLAIWAGTSWAVLIASLIRQYVF